MKRIPFSGIQHWQYRLFFSFSAVLTNHIHTFLQILLYIAFPKTENQPSGFSKFIIYVPVAFYIPF